MIQIRLCCTQCGVFWEREWDGTSIVEIECPDCLPLRFIRDVTIEECALVAEHSEIWARPNTGKNIAAAIRALKEQS